MQALILAGGEGTRLRPLTLTRPKPAIQLVDRPFIRYAIDWVARHGVTDAVIACGLGSDALREAVADEAGGTLARIEYVEEPEPLGTAGPLRLAVDEGLMDDRFLVLNGDVLADLDLGALMRAHVDHGAVVTLALHPVTDPGPYGLVRRAGGPERPGASPLTADGEVLGFVEKPALDEIDTDEISVGAYLVERSVIDLIPRGQMLSIEREVFPRLVGQGLYGHRLEGYWMDIGTPERYLEASWDILEGRVQTDAGRRLNGVGILVEDGARVDPGAHVRPPALVETDVAVGPGAVIGGRAVVGRGSTIGDGATVSSSVVLSGCRIGPEATVDEAILASGVVVGEGARIGAGAVIGEGARVEAGAEVTGRTRLAPRAVAR
jgi:mannose-1-phosphate guanylyltransferase